jgi:hypothetical protein
MQTPRNDVTLKMSATQQRIQHLRRATVERYLLAAG